MTLSPGPGLHTSGLEGASVPGVPALPHTPGRTPTPAREADLGLSKRRRMVQICSAPGSRCQHCHFSGPVALSLCTQEQPPGCQNGLPVPPVPALEMHTAPHAACTAAPRQQLCSSPHCSAATPAAAAPPCWAGRAFPGPEPAWNSEPRRQHPLGTQGCRPGVAPSSGQPGARPRRARGESPGQDAGGADCGSSWGPLARCWGPLRLPFLRPEAGCWWAKGRGEARAPRRSWPAPEQQRASKAGSEQWGAEASAMGRAASEAESAQSSQEARYPLC